MTLNERLTPLTNANDQPSVVMHVSHRISRDGGEPEARSGTGTGPCLRKHCQIIVSTGEHPLEKHINPFELLEQNLRYTFDSWPGY